MPKPLNPGAYNPSQDSGIILDPNAIGANGQPLYGMLKQPVGQQSQTSNATGQPVAQNQAPATVTPTTAINSISQSVDLGGFVPYTETDVGKADAQKLQDLNNQIGILTPAEEEAIRIRAENEGLKYESLIAQAKEQKRQGMAKSTVRAGQSGGFENTQIAGVAALSPTEGGTFAGQGGNLEEIKSAYDQNISNLEVQKQQAIAAARDALRESKITGQKDAYNRALQLFKIAEDSHNKAVDLAQKKVNILRDLNTEQRTQVKFEQDQAEAQANTIAPGLLSVLTGNQETDIKLIQEEAINRGIDPNLLLNTINKAFVTNQKEALSNAKSYYDIASKIPQGETYKVPGSDMVIIGAKEGEKMDIVQTVGDIEYKVRYDLSDPSNPKELMRIQLGPRWKSDNEGIDTDTNTNEAILQTVEYLHNLKAKGQFNELVYQSAIDALISEYPKDFTLADEEDLKTLIDKRLQRLSSTEAVQNNTQQTNLGNKNSIYNLYGIFDGVPSNKKITQSQTELSTPATYF